MILIIQVDQIEAQLAGLNVSDYKQDKDLYLKFVKLYEQNYRKFLVGIGKMDVYEAANKQGRRNDSSDPDIIREKELRDKFEMVRPYFYTFKNNYYFFRSPPYLPLGGVIYHEANIFQLEQNDIIQILEKNLVAADLFDKIKKLIYSVSIKNKLSKVVFIKDIESLNLDK